MENRTKKLCARVTPMEKTYVKKKAASHHMNESDYIISRCIDKRIIFEDYKERSINRQAKEKNRRIEIRAAESELLIIDSKAYEAHMNRSDYMITCGLGKEIIVLEDLKEFGMQLHKIGTNLNQIVLLCHQGLIQSPDITETLDYLKKIYVELNNLNKKVVTSKKRR